MKEKYKEIIDTLFRKENPKQALEKIIELFKTQGADVDYYIYNKGQENIMTSNLDLRNYLKKANKEFLKCSEGEYTFLIYNLNTLSGVIRINKCECDQELIEDEIDLFFKMFSKVIELDVYRIHSFVNPLFYEISNMLYNNKSTDIGGILEELNLLIEGVIGIDIIKIEKSLESFYFKNLQGEEIKKFSYNDMIIEYITTREIDDRLDIQKILNVIFYILYNFIEIKVLDGRNREFLEEQISSKESLQKLNRLLETSLYKMTIIGNLYTKLSKTRKIDFAVKIVEEMIKNEVEYDYLKIECGNLLIEEGVMNEKSEKIFLGEPLLDGAINYKFEFQKSEITNEERVYVNLIFNHSKIEIENMLLYKKVEELATIDGITHLYIHRFFIEALEREIEESDRYEKPLSIIMLDIDNFKHFNDTYGHQAGDQILYEVGLKMKANMRKVDIPCRYGGEEFIIILPFTDSIKAEEVAERLRKKIEEETRITVSIGVTQYMKGEDRDVFIKRVDEAMYAAKKTGKNRVVRK